MNNGDMPITPIINKAGFVTPTEDADQVCRMYGLTKREAFAMAAMQSVLSQYNPYESGDFDSSEYNVTVAHAVGLADALLEELAK